MQNILLQRSILYTIVTLFYAVATGCKRTGSKQTTIKITTPPTATQQEKETPKETDPDDLSSVKNFLDVPSKDENKEEKKEEEDDDKDIKNKIEEELAAEQQKLENSLKEEEEEKIGNPNRFQDSSDSHSVQPTAPPLPDDPPPPYDSHGWSNNNLSTSSTYNHPIPTSSKVCKKCLDNNNTYEFDEQDIKHLLENPSNKQKIRKAQLQVINILQRLSLRWKKRRLYMFKEKLLELLKEKTNLEEAQNKIVTNQALCSTHKEKKLEDNFIKIDVIHYKIERLEKIIKIIGEKNNKSDESTNIGAKPYPVQEWPNRPSIINDNQGNPTNPKGGLYPSLGDYL